jgi:hypothetical protein
MKLEPIIGQEAGEEMMGVRDAVHVAVMAVKASCDLEAGEDVTLDKDGMAVPAGKYTTGIGIVDPFIVWTVRKDAIFWLFLRPRTAVNLRHNWMHPALDGVQITKERAKQWMDNFCAKNHTTFDKLEAVLCGQFQNEGPACAVVYNHAYEYELCDENCKPTGEKDITYLCDKGSAQDVAIDLNRHKEMFLRCYSVLTGINVDRELQNGVKFGCSC